MDDSKKIDIYYLLWLPFAKNIIFRAEDKKPLSRKSSVAGLNLYTELGKYLDFPAWRRAYAALYRAWLEEDRSDLYDLNRPAHQKALAALKKLNARLPAGVCLAYWYDIDRDKNENFRWETDPINAKPLIDLGQKYKSVNRLFDKENYLLLPDNEPVESTALAKKCI